MTSSRNHEDTDVDGLRLAAGNGRVLRNLKCSAYDLAKQQTEGAVIGLACSGNVVFASVNQVGVHVYRVDGTDVERIGRLGSLGSTCFDLWANDRHVVYIMELDDDDHLSVCIHPLPVMFLDKDCPVEAQVCHMIHRRAPVSVLSSSDLLFIAGAAWTSAWSSARNDKMAKQLEGVDEKHVVALRLDSSSFVPFARWQAVEHSVFMLQTQTYQPRDLLAVADSLAGIVVYELRRSSSSSPKASIDPKNDFARVLYRIDVDDDVRNFRLVGGCVAVFHRHEPNVSFWNVAEQRTILCVNVQDQTRRLHFDEEQLPVEEDDEVDIEYIEPLDNTADSRYAGGAYGSEDDHVTSVTSLPIDGGTDHLLVYATASGCLFGMSVQRRSKVFSITCPVYSRSGGDDSVTRQRSPPSAPLAAVGFLSEGQIVVTYDGHPSLTVMNFDTENPSNERPITRCQKRVT